MIDEINNNQKLFLGFLEELEFFKHDLSNITLPHIITKLSN